MPPSSVVAPKTFVLVHGAWHGGWCWRRVADRLRHNGHQVTTPTLTGLGERAHLMSAAITMTTFIDDIAAHIAFEGLESVVLVGHSFAGGVVSGVADRLAGSGVIARLIYLDSMLVPPGRKPFDTLTPETVEARRKAARDEGNGVALPVPPMEAFGVFDDADRAWIGDRLTPHPLGAFDSPVPMNRALGAGLNVDYVVCTRPVYTPLESSRRLAKELGWPITELAAGHDAMVTAPHATADLLEALAARA